MTASVSEGTHKTSETPPAPKARGAGSLGIAFVLLLLLAGFSLAAWQLFLLQSEQREQAQKLAALPILQAEIDQSRLALTNLAQGQSQLAEGQAALTARIQAQAATLAEVRQQSTQQGEMWQLAEVATLVRMAALALNVFEDAQQATGFLRQADQVLVGVETSALVDLRAAIAFDLAQLAQVPVIDRIGLYLSLGQLMNGVPDLPLRPVKPQPKQAPRETPPIAEGFWGRLEPLWDTLWARVFDLVDFRRGEAAPKPIPTAQATQHLRQNLLLSLSTAQSALLRLEQPVFDEELSKVRAWVKDYFDPHADQQRLFLAGLAQLTTVTIKPELPSVDGSLAALAQAQRFQAVSP